MSATPIVQGYADIAAILAPSGPRRQPLKGFDDTYVDFVDYILRCTHRIWEQRNVGLIDTHYGDDALIYTSAGLVKGKHAVIANTVSTLAGFSDRSLYGENVVWCGDDSGGLLSSHRIRGHLTNLGESEFGPPTGRRATVATIADCFARENKIVLEWLVRDNAGLARQLGLDPWELARRMGWAPTPEFRDWRANEITRVLRREGRCRLLSRAPATAAERFVAQAIERIWDNRMFGLVREVYHEAAAIHAPTQRALHGWNALIGFIVGFFAPFPEARLTVDHVCSVPYGPAGTDVAVRWTFAGAHKAPGHGPPTGRDVFLIGVTHARVLDGRIAEEWIVFDELALLRQIVGAPAQPQ
jgi:predicted ester cyclase